MKGLGSLVRLPGRTALRHAGRRRIRWSGVLLALLFALALLRPGLEPPGPGPVQEETAKPARWTAVGTWQPAVPDVLGDPLPGPSLQRLGSRRLRHGGPVAGVAFVSGGAALASAGEDGTLVVWRVESGEELRQFRLGSQAGSLAASADGSRILTAVQHAGAAWLWDVGRDRAVARLLFPTPTYSSGADVAASVIREVAVSPDASLLATRRDAALDVWLGSTGRHSLRIPCQAGRGIGLLPEGRLVAVCGPRSGRLAVFDARSGRTQRSFETGADPSRPFALSADGRRAAVHLPGELRLFDLETGAQLPEAGGGLGPEVVSLALSADGRLVAAGLAGGQVVVRDTAGGARPRRVFPGHRGRVRAVAFSPDGTLLASAGADHGVRLWSLSTGTELHQAPGHRGAVRGLAFTTDGRLLLSAGADASVRVWDAGGHERQTLAFDAGVDLVVPVSSSQALVVTQSRLHVLDLESAGRVRVLDLGARRHGLAASPVTGLLATGDGSQLHVWDVRTGRRRSFPVPAPEEPLALSADGTVLATLREQAPRGVLILRDAASGRELKRVSRSQHGPGSGRCAGGSGDHLFYDGVVRRVAGLGQPRLDTVAHIGRGAECAVSPDGRLLAFRRWNPERLEVRPVGSETRPAVLARLEAHRGPIRALAFSPDSRTLASGGADSTILLWDVEALRRSAPEQPLRSASNAAEAGPRLRLDFEAGIAGPGITTVQAHPGEAVLRLADGHSGRGLRLASRLAFPETDRLILGDAWSLTLWFRFERDGFGSGAVHNVLRSQLVSIDVREAGRAYAFFHHLDDGGHASLSLDRWIGSVLPQRWYHVGVSYERSRGAIRVCVDGVCGPGPTGGHYSDRLGTLELGDASPNPIALVVDELGLLDRAVSDEEMAQAAGQPGARALAGPTPPATPTPLPAEAEPTTLPGDIGALVRLESRPAFRVHRFTGPLARVQTNDLDLGLGAVWVGTSRGLVRYDPRAATWSLYGAASGLPGERLGEIAVAGRWVVADSSRRSGPHSATDTGVHAFEPSRKAWTSLPLRGVWDLWGDGELLWAGHNGGASVRHLEPPTATRPPEANPERWFKAGGGQLLHPVVGAVRRHGSSVWFAMFGDWVEREKDFTGGGVSVWDRERDRWRSYTPEHGLARGYSCDLFVDEREVWVAHWEEEIGLSRLDRATGVWEAVRKGANGVDIGGVVLAGDPDSVWIGQQGGLVRLDRRSRQATRYREGDGLPGYIVSGLAVGKHAVWASVYGYDGRGEVDRAGLLEIPRLPPRPEVSKQRRPRP